MSEVAVELMKAMTRLRARLRSESGSGEMALTWSQLMTLSRIVKEGPVTATELAHAEHVRRQSMAETVAALRAGDLITSFPDPYDGRKSLLQATSAGVALSRSIPVAREAWLSSVVETGLTAQERQVLREAAAIMNRLADL